jgi:serine protease Do
LDEYRKYGKFLKPYLGIEYQMISESQARFYEDIVAGVLIMRVISDSPASQAGLKRLDIITEVEGKAISESFANIIQQYSIGQEMKLTVWRDGQEIELVAILGELDE